MACRTLSAEAIPLKQVHPMPPPGNPRQCRSQSVKLMLDLRKKSNLRSELRFVAFGQGCHGIHFVVEDDKSVYDQTCKFDGMPHVTRVSKETYAPIYNMADGGMPVCRLTNDQFQMLYDIMTTLQRERGPETLIETFTRMRLIVAIWSIGTDNESEAERVFRIVNRLLPGYIAVRAT